jgi:prepilin-type N-terminal cleavage/methylation domain-containing protein
VARSPFKEPWNFSVRAAFSLIELLVVISILGILAGLSVPVLKNLGKSNVQASATRQLLDDVGRARQLAISRRTTVYMVFVPTNFFNAAFLSALNNAANFPTVADRDAALIAATNLVPAQLSGYNFLTLRSIGDQPGQNTARYIDDWKSLPEGNYIAPQKFYFPPPLGPGASISISQWQNQYGRPAITNFTRVPVPFPTERSPLVSMPCLMFDHQGRLVSEAGGITDADIPLVQGQVSHGMNASKQPDFTVVNPSDITENPPGNSGIGNNNPSFNVIHIESLTGRAQLEKYKMP